MAGGVLADAAIALNVILARLYWEERQAADPRLLRQGPPADRQGEAATFRTLPGEPKKWRDDLRRPARRRVRHRDRAASLRADLAAAGGHGHRPGGQLDQGGVEPGAAEGAGDRQLPHRAGPGPGRGLRAAEGVPDQGPAVGREGDGEAARPAGEVVDDRPERPGLRGGAGGAAKPASTAKPVRHRLRRHASASSARSPSCSAAPRRCCFGIEDPHSNAHAPNESLHEGDFKKLMASLVAPVRQPGEAAGREGEVKSFSRDPAGERGRLGGGDGADNETSTLPCG